MSKKKEEMVRVELPQRKWEYVNIPPWKAPIQVLREGYGWWGLPAYDDDGKMMCQECGEFYDHLSTHIRRAHKLSGREYK